MSEVKMTVAEKIETVHTNVLAALKAAGADVETCQRNKSFGSDEQVIRISKVNGQHVSVTVEEVRTSHSWSRRDTGKIRLTVSCGYGRGWSTGYPEGKDGFPNAMRAAAKLIELVAARKELVAAEQRKEVRAKNAQEVRNELVTTYQGIEASYDSSWGHCLTGGPESFHLKLFGMTQEQVASLLSYAAEQGIVQKKVQDESEA